MKECGNFRRRGQDILWPLLYIFTGQDPIPRDLSPWLLLCCKCVLFILSAYTFKQSKCGGFTACGGAASVKPVLSRAGLAECVAGIQVRLVRVHPAGAVECVEVDSDASRFTDAVGLTCGRRIDPEVPHGA